MRDLSAGNNAKPWSPLSVTLITFLFPAGGAVLTLRNLQRLGQLDAVQVRRLSMATVLVFALGLTMLLAAAGVNRDGMPRIDGGASAILSLGVATAAYLVQQSPFRAWAVAHRARTSPWTSGIVTALVYQILAVVLTIPLFIVVAGLPWAGGITAP